MDERIFKFKTGNEIPDWDLLHRLPTSQCVGPKVKDTGATYCINSTFMDVTEQPHMERQRLAFALLSNIIGVGGMGYVVVYMFRTIAEISFSYLFAPTVGVVSIFLLTRFIILKIWRDEIFSLRTRPIRFNRREKKIYALRHRRFFTSRDKGDIVWEVPWDESTFFCIHRGSEKFDEENSYHIRCYQLNDKGEIVRTFAMGRTWHHAEGMEELLGQWNYWCMYMNQGPENLPPPMLFMSQDENLLGSIINCMLVDGGFNSSAAFRIAFMPLFISMGICRYITLKTCRKCIWPRAVEEVSQIDKDDPFNQPTNGTPVGWYETNKARVAGTYESLPEREVPGWTGPNSENNALRWARDNP
ncbi:DUF6708 domain-containing protein [Oxalobacteraceae bacterium A2-2]